jgi:hypothetical protein
LTRNHLLANTLREHLEELVVRDFKRVIQRHLRHLRHVCIVPTVPTVPTVLTVRNHF